MRSLLILAPVLLVACAARAELAGDANHLLNDYIKLDDAHQEIAAARQAFVTDAGNNSALLKDIHPFFVARNKIQPLRQLILTDRKTLRNTLSYKNKAFGKLIANRHELVQDAASYIAQYDLWVSLKAQIAADLDQMRQSADAGDHAALKAACKAYFDDGHARLQARLQWQADLAALKKDLAYKTPKIVPRMPPQQDLPADAAEYLADRADWEALGEQLGADRNSLRAAVSDPNSGSLESIVLAFLNDRHARRIKGVELYWDRYFIGTDNAYVPKDAKTTPLFTKSSVDLEDEDDELDLSPDEAGEK